MTQFSACRMRIFLLAGHSGLFLILCGVYPVYRHFKAMSLVGIERLFFYLICLFKLIYLTPKEHLQKHMDIRMTHIYVPIALYMIN